MVLAQAHCLSFRKASCRQSDSWRPRSWRPAPEWMPAPDHTTGLRPRGTPRVTPRAPYGPRAQNRVLFWAQAHVLGPGPELGPYFGPGPKIGTLFWAQAQKWNPILGPGPKLKPRPRLGKSRPGNSGTRDQLLPRKTIPGIFQALDVVKSPRQSLELDFHLGWPTKGP